jgi:peptide-methionine (S)-S-oxide reductase
MRLCALFAALVLAAAGQGRAAGPETAIFAGGRHWSLEADLARTPGVIAVETGYILDPETPSPIGAGGATEPEALEAVRVTYDPTRANYRRVLLAFWLSIDPFDAEGQFCDRGARYRPAILAIGPEQEAVATAAQRRVAQLFGREAATVVLQGGRFEPAEERHQDYARKNPARYDFYRRSCGRDAGLRRVWGAAPMLALDP